MIHADAIPGMDLILRLGKAADLSFVKTLDLGDLSLHLNDLSSYLIVIQVHTVEEGLNFQASPEWLHELIDNVLKSSACRQSHSRL